MKKKDDVSFPILLLIIFLSFAPVFGLAYQLAYGYEEVTFYVDSVHLHEKRNKTTIFGNVITNGEIGKRCTRRFVGNYTDQIEVGAIYVFTRRGPNLLNIMKLEGPLRDT